MNRLHRIMILAVLGAAFFQSRAEAQSGKRSETPPDLTQGGVADATHDWRLGPLGANGWVFTRTTATGASALARQILITRVDANGPAAENLKVDDVVLGVAGKKIDRDARRALADAINEAENKGVLKLLVWRDKKEHEAVVTLPVMGTYSKTAPFNCAKTTRIIDNACAYLKSRGALKPDWIGYIDGLGLLATGRAEVMPQVKALAHASVVPGEVLSIEKHL